MKWLSKAMSYCNNARLYLDKNTNQWAIKGDPTEGALLVVAKKAGFYYETELHDEPRIYLLPFDSSKKG